MLVMYPMLFFPVQHCVTRGQEDSPYTTVLPIPPPLFASAMWASWSISLGNTHCLPVSFFKQLATDADQDILEHSVKRLPSIVEIGGQTLCLDRACSIRVGW